MEKNNNIINSNGFSNAEMYNKSRTGWSEGTPAFYSSNLDYFDGKMTFAKAPNGYIAIILSWYDNSATYYEKVNGKWFELDAERAEAIKAELRERGRKMVEAAKKEMEINSIEAELKASFDKLEETDYDEIISDSSKTNGFSNSEMYKKSIHHIIESVGFYTADLGLVKGKTTFAKAPNGTIACLLYSSYSNAANYYEKVGDRWLKLDEERAKKIRNAIRTKYTGVQIEKAMMEQSGKNRMNEANIANIYTVNQIEIIDKELDEVWDEILENLSEEEYLEEEMKYNYGRECDETVARAIRLERKKEGLQRGGYENALAMMKKVADWFASDKVIGGKVLDSYVDRWEPICTQDLTERAWCSADVNPRSCEVRFDIIFDGDYECTDTFTCPIAELGEKTAVQLAKISYMPN